MIDKPKQETKWVRYSYCSVARLWEAVYMNGMKLGSLSKQATTSMENDEKLDQE